MAAPNKPDDQYLDYFQEKLWDLIPGIHRQEDGLAERPGVLRALIEIVAQQAAVLRRSQDRLWDDSFIDLCDEWAVPYIGDLVGTRMLSALDARGRRVDVAKTIYYRRRKGTPRVLEELINDISGWDGKLTESFRGLARWRHGLDAVPPPAGRWSRTPQHGLADLRDPRTAMLARGPFDEYSHLPDLRQQRGTDGLWNIPRLVFHLYTLLAYELEGVTPHVRADGRTFTFDPSGRDVPLFVPRRILDDWDTWTSLEPWQVPEPMTCRLLAHAEFVITEDVVLALEAAGIPAPALVDLRTIEGVRFRDEDRLRSQLSALPSSAVLLAAPTYDTILARAITADCAKRNLLAVDQPAIVIAIAPPAAAIRPEHLVAGNLASWTATVPAGKEVIVDPDRGRFSLAVAPANARTVRVGYRAALAGPIGAGAYDREAYVLDGPKQLVPPATPASAAVTFPAPAPIVAVFEISDSATYQPIANITHVRSLVLQAADLQRPYVRLDGDWTITAEAGTDAELTIDGVWFGAVGPASIVIAGAWKSVTLRHVTLDPGGVDVDGQPLSPVALSVTGTVESLVIDHSILSTIAPAPGGAIETLTVEDSILDAQVAAVPAITLTPGSTVLRRVTVLGALDVDHLDASDSLITGNADVTDLQDGCFRFSAAPTGSRVPHPYRSVTLTDVRLFTSTRFGDPGYAQLAEIAVASVVRGAENGGEIGAWNSLISPIKLDCLGRKVAEYMPFGLIPCFVRRT